jgi:RNA polymerase sigma-70 factor (ECF subfamily)
MRETQLDATLVEQMHRKANAARWELTRERFAEALTSTVEHALAGKRDAGSIERYLHSVHAEDLALAIACADGHEGAWDHFIRQHRPVLYRAADALDRTGAAREAADSLYGELFGTKSESGERRSLFRYYHGRSSLATWLRAVLAQRYVDEVRRQRRLEPLPADEEPHAGPGADQAISADRARLLAIVQTAITAAVAAIAPRDRLRLTLYYARDLTLAQIGRTLGEHEATSSRQLARTRRQIREQVEQRLRQDGMPEADVSEALASVAADAGTLDLDEMLGTGRKNPDEDRST